ncbi:hypothetical protein [Lachnobacterium bovis]|uniref:LXG domain of WXG superfamily protein n=1 Tax=Lachnobacterium bovis TaxID=140626 RepID=A0A1H9UZ30_9FIRM|nr:hypothetical protein [Lachnobacterium bovis]SES14676.1 hypothetical protein SAMN02910429_02327 [Lachnobacterium bovis]
MSGLRYVLDKNQIVDMCNKSNKLISKRREELMKSFKSVEEFTNDKLVLSKSFDNYKQIMRDYSVVIAAMLAACEMDNEDFTTLKNAVSKIKEHKIIEFDEVDDQLLRITNMRDNLNQRYKDLSNPMLNNYASFNPDTKKQMQDYYKSQIKKYGDLIKEINDDKQLYRDIENSTSHLFEGSLLYWNNAQGLLDEIKASFDASKEEYTIKQNSNFRNVLINDSKVGEAINSSLDKIFLEHGLTPKELEDFKKLGIPMLSVYKAGLSDGVIKLIKGKTSDLNKIFSESPDSIGYDDPSLCAFLPTYMCLTYKKDSDKYAKIINAISNSVYVPDTDDQGQHLTTDEKFKLNTLDLYMYTHGASDNEKAKLRCEGRVHLASYCIEWLDYLRGGVLQQANLYSMKTVAAYKAAQNMEGDCKKANMYIAKSMYQSYNDSMDVYSSLSGFRDISSKNVMFKIDKIGKNQKFEITKYYTKDVPGIYDPVYEKKSSVCFSFLSQSNDAINNKSEVDAKDDENKKKIEYSEHQCAKTAFYTVIQLIPGSGPVYDAIYSADQLSSGNYNCITQQDKIFAKPFQIGGKFLLNSATLVGQMGELDALKKQAEEEHKAGVESAYSKWFSSYCSYQETEKGSKKEKTVISDHTLAGQNPATRIAMEKWEKEGTKGWFDADTRSQKIDQINKQDLQSEEINKFYNRKKVFLNDSKEQEEFNTEASSFESYKNRSNDQAFKFSNDSLKQFQSGVNSISGELIN